MGCGGSLVCRPGPGWIDWHGALETAGSLSESTGSQVQAGCPGRRRDRGHVAVGGGTTAVVSADTEQEKPREHSRASRMVRLPRPSLDSIRGIRDFLGAHLRLRLEPPFGGGEELHE